MQLLLKESTAHDSADAARVLPHHGQRPSSRPLGLVSCLRWYSKPAKVIAYLACASTSTYLSDIQLTGAPVYTHKSKVICVLLVLPEETREGALTRGQPSRQAPSEAYLQGMHAEWPGQQDRYASPNTRLPPSHAY